MKAISIIILMLCLLQPLVCFAHPCTSCLDASDTVDVSDSADAATPHHDSDNCDSTVCCAEFIGQSFTASIVYAPVISVASTPEQFKRLPRVVIPIFIPPQNFA